MTTINSTLHPDRIALLSGRPVLAFPIGADTTKVSSRVMIAWDGSRSAARALNSSMRLLETKGAVKVITIGKPSRVKKTDSGLDPVTALNRQGLDASWINVPKKSGGVAQTILEQVKANNIDLLIMGAYEHSKFREDLFGGVTNKVMTNTPIPVFLAH